jgi:hypothetical protein
MREADKFLKDGRQDPGMLVETPTSPRRRVRRWAVPAALVVVVALVVAGGIGWLSRRDRETPAADAPVAVETAAVVKTDLSATESLTGTLGYGRAQPVKGSRDGVVTWLPQPGTSVRRGKQVYRVADRPVPLFYGGMPLYRDLATTGTVGRDVRIVADNIRSLGYSIGRQPGPGEKVTRVTAAPPPPPGPTPASASPSPTVTTTTVHKGEGVLTRSLIAALKKWQRDAGLAATGRIAVGDVVVLPGAVRIDSVTAQPGDSAAGPLMTVTPTAKVITVAAAVAEAATIERGDQVTVVLPGDKSVRGEVSAVGTAVRKDDEGGGDSDPKREVTVTVTDDRKLGGIDAAEVQVDFVGETHENILAVPVGALVALSEGGYAVQIAGGDSLVAVEIGMFAKGLVEVTGDGLRPGTKVVTTS